MAPLIYKSRYADIPEYYGSIPELLTKHSPYLRSRSDVALFTDVNTGKTLSVAEHYAYVRALSVVLKTRFNITPGTVVCLYAPNDIYLPGVHHAILWAGGVVSPVNSAYTEADIKEQVESADARLIIAKKGAMAELGARVAKAVHTQKVVCAVHDDLVADALCNLKAGAGPAGDPEKLTKSAKETLAYLCFSSGTTGKFKGVMTSHFNMTNNVLQSVMAGAVQFNPNGVYAGFLPMTHIYALNSHIYATVYICAQVIVFPQFDFEMFLKACLRYQMSHIFLVPPVMVLLAKSPLVDKYSEIKKYFQIVFSGAAPLSKTLAEAVKARIGGTFVVCQGYGLTEGSPVINITPVNRPDEKVGTIGWLVPNLEARLIDEQTGEDAPRGGPGELVLRGPNIMMGYLNNPTATTETLIGDGWMRTGDVASVDDEGYWTIVDRSKEMIKSKGFQVAPAELEALLLQHPHVVDAAVIGHWSEEEATEHPRAFVVMTSQGDAAQIKQWVDEQVAKHKKLWGGIVAIDQIPKSPSGKILRRFLKERVGDIVVGTRKIARL
ncbi:uncharacterized protein V1518DRAFT_414748 [Limtongia smithiae]|uniref:uncharacterized protein n=1 Tax=Limtongia smithiae TaxID=1125753 RepID=UPI0034CE2310